MEAWSPTDDNEGVLIKADALREQAREVLVSAARSRTSPAGLGSWSGSGLGLCYQCTVQSPCRRARRRLLRRGRCLSLSLSLGYSRSRSRSRSRRRTRGQGRMRSTLRPSTHRPSSVASSITLPSCSSTTGSKIQAELGCCRLHRAPPVGPGQLDTGIGHSVTASQPAALKAADPNFV